MVKEIESNMDIVKLDLFNLCRLMYQLASEAEADITAVLFQPDVEELMCMLLQLPDTSCFDISIPFDYGEEYYVNITPDLEIAIVPVYEYDDGGNKVISSELHTDAIFFDGDASAQIAAENEDCLQFEIEWEDDEICDEDDCEDASDCRKCWVRDFVESYIV